MFAFFTNPLVLSIGTHALALMAGMVFKTKITDFLRGIPSSARVAMRNVEADMRAKLKAAEADVLAKIPGAISVAVAKVAQAPAAVAAKATALSPLPKSLGDVKDILTTEVKNPLAPSAPAAPAAPTPPTAPAA